VPEVVQEQTTNGQSLEVVHPRGRRQVGESAVRGLEGQRDERLEAPRRILRLAESQHMVHPVNVRLHVAVQHGGIRPEAEPVGRPVDRQPLFA